MSDTIPDLSSLVLLKGSHDTRDEGVCLLEAAAWFAGREHTDHPPCVSPVLGSFGRHLNDLLPDDSRQLLKPFIPGLLDTAGDGHDETRSYLALDWLIRTWLPAWLDLAALADHASALRQLEPLTDLTAVRSANPVVRAAQDAAWAAAQATVRDATQAAAWDAARAAAQAAAWTFLAPTVTALQLDAIRLFGVMIDA